METHILQQNEKEIDEESRVKLAHSIACYKDLHHLALNLLKAKTKS